MPRQTPELHLIAILGKARTKTGTRAAVALIADRDADVAAEAARVERARCYALASGWLEQYVDCDIKYVSAREYASSAVADIAQAIRDGARP